MRLNHRIRSLRGADSQSGQAFLVIVIFIASFLLAVLGLATDFTAVWAHRQNAQNAADAACQAGSADLLLNAINPSASGTGGIGSFSWIGTDFDCPSSSSIPPCRYAALNGYASNVHVSFPKSVDGVGSLTGPFASISYPYLQVTVTDPVALYFSKIVSPTSSVNVTAKATCGLSPLSTPVPVLILHPTASGALSATGSSKITVVGGPQRSIEVDSANALALSVGTTNTNIDLSQGGPAGTGSDVGVLGGPTTNPGGINLGSSGHYIFPANPFSDPYAGQNAPSTPGNNGTTTPVPFAIKGCPDPAGCVEFGGGNYTSCTTAVTYASTVNPPNGCLVIPITIGFNDRSKNHPYGLGDVILPTKNNPANNAYKITTAGTSANVNNTSFPPGGVSWSATTQADGTAVWTNIGALPSGSVQTAIFDPGLYYVGTNGLTLNSNSTVRMSTAAGDGNTGVTFYFSTADTVSVTSNSGKSAACTAASPGSGTPNGCIVSYSRDGNNSSAATGNVPSLALQCPSGSANPPSVPASLDGNILLGPCSGTYKSPDGNRGFLFFQNRSVAAQPSWGGGGQFLSSGFLYFHSGSGATCGANPGGTTCLTLKGGSGSQSYTLGNIVADEVALSGNPQINMILNPAATFFVLKARLLQ